MDSTETKKLALLRILQILWTYSDAEHPLTQEQISQYLRAEWGILMERKAIGRNLSLLAEAGIEIVSGRKGTYLAERVFEDSELRLLIDGVLASRHIPVGQSKELIDRLCGLSNRYFKRHVKHIHTVDEWSKTANQNLFYNIEVVDESIESGRMVEYDYNKYGIDKQLHKTSFQRISPYQMILHRQQYYLMGYSSYWGHMVYHRMDHITNMIPSAQKAVPLTDVKGFEHGIDYRHLTMSMPYMFSDMPVRVTFLAEEWMTDQLVDWFGTDIQMTKQQDKLHVSLTVSPHAMLYWALQYAGAVEILTPVSLRDEVKTALSNALNRYQS